MPIVSTVRFSEKQIDVTLNDGSSFTALYTVANSVLLREGAEISVEDIARLKEEYVRTRCVAAALSYLRLPHTERDLAVHLKKKEFSAEQTAATLDYCRVNGFVNDEEYASRYIESVIARKCAGELYFQKKLFEKGINQTLVKKIVAHFAPEINRIDSILRFAAKKNKGPVTRERLYRFLISRGYTDGVVRRALAAAVEEGILVNGDDDAES